MSQHDYNVANQSRTLFRADMNLAFVAGQELNSGATAPATTYAYQLWADTTTGLLKQRNAANSGWLVRGSLTETSGSTRWDSLKRGDIAGLRLSNNATDPTNDIDITTGLARDSTHAEDIVLTSALTKQLDAAWAVGTNQGGRDAGAISNAWWHVWLIKRSDTGVVDALFSLSATAPTMPTNYDYKRRIGAVLRTGSSTLRQFSQVGDYFRWNSSSNDVVQATPGSTAALYTLTVPGGVKVRVFGNVQANSTDYVMVSDPASTDNAVDSTNCTLRTDGAGGCYYECVTDTSSRVRVRLNSGAVATLIMVTDGYYDRRGQDE